MTMQFPGQLPVQIPKGPSKFFVTFRLETAVYTDVPKRGATPLEWHMIASVNTDGHVMQVILDGLAKVEVVRAVWPNGAIMKPGDGN